MDAGIRKNGLQRPFHIFQVTSWVFQVFNATTMYTVTIPCINPEFRIATAVLFTVLQILIVFFGYKLSKSDPTDRLVILFKYTTDKS